MSLDMERKIDSALNRLFGLQIRGESDTPGRLRNSLKVTEDQFLVVLREMERRGLIEVVAADPNKPGPRTPRIFPKYILRGPEGISEILDTKYVPKPTDRPNPMLAAAKEKAEPFTLIDVPRAEFPMHAVAELNSLSKGPDGYMIDHGKIKFRLAQMTDMEYVEEFLHRMSNPFYEEHWMKNGLIWMPTKEDEEPYYKRRLAHDSGEFMNWTPLQNALGHFTDYLRGPARDNFDRAKGGLERALARGVTHQNILDPENIHLTPLVYPLSDKNPRVETAEKHGLDVDDPTLKVYWQWTKTRDEPPKPIMDVLEIMRDHATMDKPPTWMQVLDHLGLLTD